MGNITQIANLDYADIRKELKDYLKNQSEFTDYDFEGSGINVLIDILAYNTHMNAMMSHMVMNESFLDTAQLRSNVVSHAQLIGYTPRSARSSHVGLNVTIQGNAQSPAVITMPKNTKFAGKINNTEYTFITDTDYTSAKLANNSYVFENVIAYEGTLHSSKYTVDGLVENQRFELPFVSVDTASLAVKVFANATTDVYDSYELFNSAVQAGPTSKVYFIKENQFGKYAIYFGDGAIGYKPPTGSVIEISYIDTKGAEANNIIAFTSSSSIGGISDVTVALATDYVMSINGKDRETVESIRYNAPLFYSTQDRAVTANDYRALILNEFNDLADVSVWGGEEADPPVYGKTFLSPILADGNKLTQAYKNSIISFLRGKSVGSIIPEIIDAEYTYIDLEVGIKYDLQKTDKSVGELRTIILDTIDAYNNDILASFSAVYRQSNLSTLIDNSDGGIISNIIRAKMHKKIITDASQAQRYTIKFPVSLYIEDDEVNISSSEFLIDGEYARIGDEINENDPNLRNVYFYDRAGIKIPAYSSVGYIDIEAGLILLESVKFDTTSVIDIRVRPNSYDIAPIYNQVLSIDDDRTIIMEEDTVSVLGSAGLTTYVPYKRH